MFNEYDEEKLSYEDSIYELDLSTRAFTALRQNNIKTINDLVNIIQNGEIERFRNIGNGTINEIKQILKQKCDITVESDFNKLGLSNKAKSRLRNEFNVNTIDELLNISYLDENSIVESEIIDKVHNYGLEFKYEKELDDENSIYELDLSTRAFTALRRNKIKTIDDLVDIIQNGEIERFRNIGIGTLNEIKQILKQKYDITVESDFNKLGLSNRAKSRLINYFKVNTIDELLNIPLRNNYRGLDKKTVTGLEIINKVHSHGLKFKDEEKIKNIEDDIYYLDFDKNADAFLKLNSYGVHTIEDLLNLSTSKDVKFPQSGLYRVRGFGEQKVNEIIDLAHSHGFIFKDEINNPDVIGKFSAITFDNNKYDFIVSKNMTIDCPTIGLQGFRRIIIKPRFELIGGINRQCYICPASYDNSDGLIREYQIDDELLEFLYKYDMARYSTDMAYYYGFKNKDGYDTKWGYRTNGKPFKWAAKKGEILVKQRKGQFN